MALAGLSLASVTVNGITVTITKTDYFKGEEAIAQAVIDFNGNKNELQSVDFTWYYPGGQVAKYDLNVAPDGSGTAYSSWKTDTEGTGFTVKAIYTGDTSIQDTTTFNVGPAKPGTPVSGHITSNTIWNLAKSPYVVVDNVTVDTGITLTINAGVVVRFNDLTKLKVEGTLMAMGMVTNYITFTSNNTAPFPGAWLCIAFNNQGSSGSYMTYCRIEYSYYGLYIYNSSPTITKSIIREIYRDGIYIYQSTAYLAYNTITGITYEFGSNTGILVGPDSNPMLLRNVIKDVEEYGIKISYTEATIDGNIISNCTYPIYIKESTAIVKNNTVWDGAVGVYLDKAPNVTVWGNTIMNNSKQGIYSFQSWPLIENNKISHNGDEGILIFDCQDTEIKKNTVYENDWGIKLIENDNLKLSENNAVNNIRHGLWLQDSSNINISNNILIGNENGILIENSDNTEVLNNKLTGNVWRGAWVKASSKSDIENNIFQDNNYGLYLNLSTDFTILNNTFLDNFYGMSSDHTLYTVENGTLSNKIYDFYLLVGSNVTSLNNTFEYDNVFVSEDSILVVNNYLHVKVEDKDNEPIKGADIEIKDNGKVIFAEQTDDNGTCNWILLTDRIYNSSSPPKENSTIVTVKYKDAAFPWNPRDIDMSTSHIEKFGITDKPLLTITSPEKGAVINGTFGINGTATDEDGFIVFVEISIEYSPWMTVDDVSIGKDWSVWEFILNTTMYKNGTYNLSAHALDDDWAETYVTTNFIIRNEPGGPYNDTDDDGPGNDTDDDGGPGNDTDDDGGPGNDTDDDDDGGPGNDTTDDGGGPGNDTTDDGGGPGNDTTDDGGGPGNDTTDDGGGPGNDTTDGGGPGNDTTDDGGQDSPIESEDGDEKEGENWLNFTNILLIILIIVVICLILLMLIKKEDKDKRDEVEEKKIEVIGKKPQVKAKRREVKGKKREVEFKKREVTGKKPQVKDKRMVTIGKKREVEFKKREVKGKKSEIKYRKRVARVKTGEVKDRPKVKKIPKSSLLEMRKK